MRPFPFSILAMFSPFPETESLLTGYIIRSKGSIEKTADGPDLVYSKAVCGPKTHPNFYHRYTAVNVRRVGGRFEQTPFAGQ